MTPLRTLTFLILMLLLMIIGAIIWKNYVFSLLLFSLLLFLFYRWYILLTEELIIYRLMNSNNKMGLDRLIDDFGKKTIKAVKNLKDKKLVEQDGDDIILKKKEFKLSMTKWRPGR